MLDALKFAFEIMMVGALALPWLAVLNRMFAFNPASHLQFDLSFVPKRSQDAVTAAVIIALGYLLGSAVSRISRNFFNDELWLGVPTERQIREAVYYDAYCKNHLITATYLPFMRPAAPTKFAFCPEAVKPDTPEQFKVRVDDLFRLQEGAVLLQGQDKVERLKEFYDQITVLRGAALNGFILFALCGFGMCANVRAHWSGSRVLQSLTFVPAVLVVAWGARALRDYLHDSSKNSFTHPPLAEALFIGLGVVGLFAIAKAVTALSYWRMCLVAAIITAVSFGGWWWTEVMYDLDVIHAQPQLRDAAAPGNRK